MTGPLFEISLGWESVRSNSFGYSVGRRSAESAVSGWLPWRVLAQARGRIESTSYHDRDLARVFVLRSGENQEAGDDNNSMILRLRRPIRKGLALDGRVAWFRNESLLVGSFYRKTTATIGVTWAPLGASDF